MTPGPLQVLQPDPDPSPGSEIPLTHYPFTQQVFNEHLLCARQQGRVVPEHKHLRLEGTVWTRGYLVSCAEWDEGGDSPGDVTSGTQGRSTSQGREAGAETGGLGKAQQDSRGGLRAEGQEVRA